MASCRLLHHGAAASFSSKTLVCIPSTRKDNSPSPSSSLSSSSSSSSEVVFASHGIINVAHQTKNSIIDDPIWKVYQTLRTTAETNVNRVITCMSMLKNRKGENNDNNNEQDVIIVAGFSDGNLTFFKRQSDNSGWVEHVPILSTNNDNNRSLTDIDGAIIGDTGKMIVVTCSSAGAKFYIFQDYNQTGPTTLVRSPAATVRIQEMIIKNDNDNDFFIFIGTASPRYNKIHIFVFGSENEHPQYAGHLTGHEDWVTTFDCTRIVTNPDISMLASGSHDARIRLWKFTSTALISAVDTKAVNSAPVDNLDNINNDDGDVDDDEDNGNEDDEEVESRLTIIGSDGKTSTSVSLEALLLGHEERVTSVNWHPNPALYGQELVLLSSSMDRAILVWSENDSGVWTPLTRVGSAGGILGGSIGSSLLGFVNVKVDPIQGDWLVGHGYGGALHFFTTQVETSEETITEMSVDERASLIRYKNTPCLTGHFKGVTDLCWESEYGDYLLTVSTDQTCRLWTPLPPTKNDKQENQWVELGRPQVHGYDLSAVTSLSSPSHRHLMVSAGEEKELRVFDASSSFIRLLRSVSRISDMIPPDTIDRVERAFIPSLGLSNKANPSERAEEEDDNQNNTDETTTKDNNNNNESTSEKIKLPFERDLGAVSLWPEVGKLYGHDSELYCLTTSISSRTGLNKYQSSPYTKDLFLASAAKARNENDARIRIWDVAQNKCVQVLTGGHKSTVASLSFSSDGKYLVSSGKDRQICIWKRVEHDQQDTTENNSDNLFYLSSILVSAHKRIIWSVHFCPLDPTIMASGSRDGSIKIWKITEDVVDNIIKTRVEERFKFVPSSKSSTANSVTSLSFAPVSSGDGNNNDNINSLLAVGLESGCIEIWQIPLQSNNDKSNNNASPVCLLCFPNDLNHIATVTKLAWRPVVDDGSTRSQLVLASCSLDFGCRIFDISLNLR